MSLQITCDTNLDKGILLVHLAGMLNTDTVKQFDAVVSEEKLSAFHYVLLDMKALDYISSAGFRSVFKITKQLQAKGGELTVANRQPQVKKVFDIIQALPQMHFFSSDEEMDAYLSQIQSNVVPGT